MTGSRYRGVARAFTGHCCCVRISDRSAAWTSGELVDGSKEFVVWI